MITINESLLDEHLGKLESARAWSPRVISKLENFIRTAEDYDLFRVNPIQYTIKKPGFLHPGFLIATIFSYEEVDFLNGEVFSPGITRR